MNTFLLRLARTLALPLGIIASSSSALAVNTIVLRGSVPTVCTVNVISNASSTSLNVVTGGSTVVGKVKEDCNYHGGYTVKAASATGGYLVNKSQSNIKNSYSVTVQDGLSNVNVATNPTTVRSVGPMTTPAVDVQKDLTVVMAANPNAMAGDYEDTLTFTITTP